MLVKNLVGTLAVLAAPLAVAEFSTYTNDWPNSPSTVNEHITPPPPKERTAPLTSKEKACLRAATMKRVPEVCNLYVAFGGWQGTNQLRHISNQSSGSLANLTVATDSLTKKGLDWEISAGSAVNEKVRFELGYIHHKKVNYNPNPVLVGNAAYLTSSVMNQSLLVSMYVDFRPVDYFLPYVGVMTGFVWNQTRSTASGGTLGVGTANTSDQYGYAWGATAGARMPFMDRYFVYFGYRYMSLAKMIWKNDSGLMNLKGSYVSTGFNFGVQCLVGD